MRQAPNGSSGNLDKEGLPKEPDFKRFFPRGGSKDDAKYSPNDPNHYSPNGFDPKFEPNYIGNDGGGKKKKKKGKVQNATQEASMCPGAAILAGGLTASGATVEVPPVAGTIILGTLIVYTGYKIYEAIEEILDDSSETTIGHYDSMSRKKQKSSESEYISEAEHTSNARPSSKATHEKGQARKGRDKGGEKGDVRRRRYK